MLGQLYINDKDAYQNWGAVIQVSSLSNLLQRGEQKPFTENEFRSIDGKQVKPKNPRQDWRTFTVDISIKGNSMSDFLTKYESFFEELSTGLVSFRVPILGKTFKLIYKKNQKRMNETGDSFATYKITFEEPNPADRS